MRIYNTQALTSSTSGAVLPNTWSGTNAVPTVLAGGAGSAGFGFNISSVVGSTVPAFTALTYSPFLTSIPAAGTYDVLAASAPTGNVTNSAIITYKIAVDFTAKASTYTTTTLFVVVPTYQ